MNTEQNTFPSKGKRFRFRHINDMDHGMSHYHDKEGTIIREDHGDGDGWVVRFDGEVAHTVTWEEEMIPTKNEATIGKKAKVGQHV